jgi:hypothetical protein
MIATSWRNLLTGAAYQTEGHQGLEAHGTHWRLPVLRDVRRVNTVPGFCITSAVVTFQRARRLQRKPMPVSGF